jgi:hypothetical protein
MATSQNLALSPQELLHLCPGKGAHPFWRIRGDPKAASASIREGCLSTGQRENDRVQRLPVF